MLKETFSSQLCEIFFWKIQEFFYIRQPPKVHYLFLIFVVKYLSFGSVCIGKVLLTGIIRFNLIRNLDFVGDFKMKKCINKCNVQSENV